MTKNIKEQHRNKMVNLNVKSELNISGTVEEIVAIHGTLGV